MTTNIANPLNISWNITEDGLKLLTENHTIKDKRIILQNALNTDMKDYGKPVLVTELTKNQLNKIVLQIQKVRNISAPKANEASQAAPRMLKLILTDGHSYCQAIEITSISGISAEKTPPGSKLLIHNANVISSFVLLEPSNCEFLGGKVTHLYEKWELSKNLLKHSRNLGGGSGDGAPSWVNFGTKIMQSNNQTFKSLETKNKDDNQQNEFNLQRQDAIAEVAAGARKKVFGGGVKQTFVQPTNYRSETVEQNNTTYNNYKGKNRKEKVEEKIQRPPESVSLFDFLEDKLSTNNAVSDNKNVNKSKDMKNWNENPNKYNYNNRFSDNNSTNKSTSYNKTELVINNSKANNQVEELTNNFAKVSVNSQFASRSLRQHLNLKPTTNETTTPSVSSNWNVGDQCMAKYWEDNKHYNATITDVTANTCVVKFNGYGNIEEVLKADCLPVYNKPKYNRNKGNFVRPYSGGTEFRRKKQF